MANEWLLGWLIQPSMKTMAWPINEVFDKNTARMTSQLICSLHIVCPIWLAGLLCTSSELSLLDEDFSIPHSCLFQGTELFKHTSLRYSALYFSVKRVHITHKVLAQERTPRGNKPSQ